jgi:hypothetical protein
MATKRWAFPLSGSELADVEVDVADLIGLEALDLVPRRARQARDAIGPKPDPRADVSSADRAL